MMNCLILLDYIKKERFIIVLMMNCLILLDYIKKERFIRLY
jgi:hypothetical protein